jgi:hypothetical protein
VYGQSDEYVYHDPSSFYAGWVLFVLKEVFMMATNLAQYIKQERVNRGLNYAELSRKMSYKNINRGMRRIIDLERENEAHPEVLEKIIVALELSRDKVDQLIEEDKEQQRRVFEAWIDAPIKWHLIIRWMPAVYCEREIPGYIKTEEEAIEYALSVAKEYSSMVWLVLSRKENIHIDKNGNVKSRNEITQDFMNLPYMDIR